VKSSAFHGGEDFALGEQTWRAIVGDAHVEQTYENASEFSKGWFEYANETTWARAWNFPGLDRRTKSICTVAILAALGDARALQTHIRSALRMGISPEELAAIFVQVAAYAGTPRGAAATQLADSIISAQTASSS
jgi:alkylhydroperoxidase/carboxymuconolactone decarboxylase family protein YurZ